MEEFRIRSREYMKNYKRSPTALAHKKEHQKSYDKLHRKKLLLLVDQKLGTKCVICGSTENLVCHEIHGKTHSYKPNYVLSHIEDFTRLCRGCHLLLHRLYNSHRQIKMEALVKLLNQLDKQSTV